MRRSISLVGATAVALGTAIAAGATPASADAFCSSGPQYTITADNGNSSNHLHMHAHNDPVTVSTDPSPQAFYFCNAQRWTDPVTGNIVTVQRMSLAPNVDLCVDNNPNNADINYAESCPDGAYKPELFMPVNDGGCTLGSNVGCIWLINVEATETACGGSCHGNTHVYQYMTEQSTSNGADVQNVGPGAGGRATWEYACALSCFASSSAPPPFKVYNLTNR